MDIKLFDTKAKSESGVDIELRDLRTGKGSGVFITVIGTDSDRFAELSAECARRISQILADTGQQELNRDQMNKMSIELLAGCTLGWRGLEANGEPMAFSTDAARWLYTDYPAIREQINVAIADRKNFLSA